MPLSSNPPIHSSAFAIYPFISLGNFDRSVSNAKRKKNRVKYSAPCAQACSFVRIRAISYSNISGISWEVAALSVRRCISVAPLERPPFRFRSRRKRKIGCSFARGKIRFPFEFLHLNEARRIRGRKEGNGNEARIHAHIDKYAHNCISNSLARTTVVLTPSSRPGFSTLCCRSFSSTFQPRRPPRSLIYLFPRVSRCRLRSFSLFIVASRCFPSSAISFDFLRSVPRGLVVVVARRRSSNRLDFDVAQEPPISGNWLRHGATLRSAVFKGSTSFFHGNKSSSFSSLSPS